MTFLGQMVKCFRERPIKRSFKNFGKNVARPVSEVLDPLVYRYHTIVGPIDEETARIQRSRKESASRSPSDRSVSSSRQSSRKHSSSSSSREAAVDSCGSSLWHGGQC